MGDYTPTWLDKLQDALTVPTRWCKPLISVQWGWGTRRWPNPLAIRAQTFTETQSLYMNGIVFASVRVLFVNVMLRWWGEGSPFTWRGRECPAFVQIHLGWRPIDGRPVAVFRFQTDASAQGGLAIGFEDGPK